jgi:hypothetical protein
MLNSLAFETLGVQPTAVSHIITRYTVWETIFGVFSNLLKTSDEHHSRQKVSDARVIYSTVQRPLQNQYKDNTSRTQFKQPTFVMQVSSPADAHIYQKSISHLKILGSRRVTWGKFHNVNP